MIDFSKIYGFKQGQRNSFEELVCQLARHETFPKNSVFRRVEGAGGDGGVEAYWTKPNGKKTGYQAKYFLRSGDIDWNQIDASVTQALATHPELECYVVALPCDLTAKAGTKRRVKSGWDHWEDHVNNWEKEAAASGIKEIEFKSWTSSDLVERLAKSNAEGLRQFFFGDVELTAEWFKDKIQEAASSLGDRFHPEDHVDVHIQRLFSVISRTQSCKEELSEAINAIDRFVLPERELSKLQKQPDKKVINKVKKSIDELLTIKDQVGLDPQHGWDTASWGALIEELRIAYNELREWCWDYYRTSKKDDPDHMTIWEVVRDCSALEAAFERLSGLVQSQYMKAENKRFALIRGNAGSGKSHLLAMCAERAIELGHPALLLLGQRMNDSELWTQVSQMLGLPVGSADQVLGALDAAGKASNIRTLLLIDAINEGAGGKYWRNQLDSLAHKLKKFSHVCCIISCRTEYFELAVPESIAKQYPVFEIRGFETPEEQLHAARIYLDRRGIARPSTPWLSPEFVNPLFLRSVCLSLERDKKSEFPPGLIGTRKMLKYYLDSIGRNITEKEGGAIPLTSRLGQTVFDIAGEMIASKTDFIELDSCLSLIASRFKNIQPQTEPDWLSVLLNNGLLRRDPKPSADDFADEEVVRFGFQRFQDYLMAEKALEGIDKAHGLFGEDGPLGFCIEGNQLAWEWRGLMEALTVALPEKFGIELIEALPGGCEKWWNDWSIQEAFAESVKWRIHSAFTDRSLELLNKLRYQNRTELLFQVAISSDHPWNAEFIHSNLYKKKIAVRDAFWTTWVNTQSSDEDSCVGILIEWCRSGQAPHTNHKNQYLASLILCWLFASSNNAIRDKATKALTNIFLANENIFPELLKRFADVDDLYILERILAAAYASCCRSPEAGRLSKYSEVTFEYIFESGKPPLGILLRDYAFGIIEISAMHSALSGKIDFKLCKPPYKSPKLRMSISKEKIKEVAEKAGGEQILWSATGGDFAIYEIQPRIGEFLRVPLNKAVPLTDSQKARLFEEEVVQNMPKRKVIFEKLRNAANPFKAGFMRVLIDAKDYIEPSQEQIDEWQAGIADAEKSFLKLLSDDEINRFHTEAAPYIYNLNSTSSRKEKETLDIAAAQRWVAKRAYDFGWTKDKFNDENSHHYDYSRNRPKVERIGKKYQWLALDELICRLADNYWMEGDFRGFPKQYGSPLDIGFERDIDPTILEEKEDHESVSQTINTWAFEPWIRLDKVEENQLVSWPFEISPAANLKSLPFRTDPNGVRWLVVYEHQSKREKYDPSIGEHGSRMQEFRFLATVLVKSIFAENIADRFKEKGMSNGINWTISEVTDAAFLHEAPWRNTWNQEKWFFDHWYLPDEVGYAQIAMRYFWESNRDSSLPEGYSCHLPSPWLAQEINLHVDTKQTGVWLDHNNEIVFLEFKGEEGGIVCLLRSDKVEEIVGDKYTFLSTFISERNVWPAGSNSNAAWRRSEGVCWKDGRGMRDLSWDQDRNNADTAE